MDVHAAQLGSSVITATGPVSFALAIADDGSEPLFEGAWGFSEPPSPKSNVTARAVASTAMRVTAPNAHLRLLPRVGGSASDGTLLSLSHSSHEPPRFLLVDE
ncbi:MAG TPA: hypothetical protein VEF72_21960 [Mycobacterium sp.]|nr:hypothetical protein [Mycobacterium sp.]